MTTFLDVIGFRSSGWAGLWGGIIGDVGLFTAAVGFYFHHTCQEHGCWRIGKHRVTENGIDSPSCRRHVRSANHLGRAR